MHCGVHRGVPLSCVRQGGRAALLEDKGVPTCTHSNTAISASDGVSSGFSFFHSLQCRRNRTRGTQAALKGGEQGTESARLHTQPGAESAYAHTKGRYQHGVGKRGKAWESVGEFV